MNVCKAEGLMWVGAEEKLENKSYANKSKLSGMKSLTVGVFKLQILSTNAYRGSQQTELDIMKVPQSLKVIHGLTPSIGLH